MPVARALRLPIIAVVAALALSGCMSTTGPVAVGPQGGVDAVAYGQAYAPAAGRRCRRRRCDQRTALGLRQRVRPAMTMPPAVALAPGRGLCRRAGRPVGYDNAYHLGPGDKLRVVVYGQEGLTNTYAIDAAGSITMPLIGAVPARGRTPAGLAAEIAGTAAQRLHPRAVGRGRDRVLSPVLHPRRSRRARPVSLCAEHDRRERGRDRRRLLAARAARQRHADAHRCRPAPARFVVPLGTPMSPGDTVFVGERWF